MCVHVSASIPCWCQAARGPELKPLPPNGTMAQPLVWKRVGWPGQVAWPGEGRNNLLWSTLLPRLSHARSLHRQESPGHMHDKECMWGGGTCSHNACVFVEPCVNSWKEPRCKLTAQ